MKRILNSLGEADYGPRPDVPKDIGVFIRTFPRKVVVPSACVDDLLIVDNMLALHARRLDQQQEFKEVMEGLS